MRLCESIGVTTSEFLDFLIDVDRGYLSNAYHTFYHAVDVALAMYQMVYQYDVKNYLSRIDLAALFIAGLCHDIGHPGKNNNYQVNLKTELAKSYSNKSVLESYSCTLTMNLLTKHKLLQHVERASMSFGLPTTEPEMKTAIIKMILATDMIFHYELQENMACLLELIIDHEELEGNHDSILEEDEVNPAEIKDIFSNQGAKSAISYFRKKSYFDDSIPLYLKLMPQLASKSLEKDIDYFSPRNLNQDSLPPRYIIEPQQRLILCQIILHAADIFNALRPWPICKKWSNLVCEEFFCQGEAEQEHGLAISPNMDRNQVRQTTIGLQFGDFVVSPYFEILAALFPKSDELLKTLAKNRTEWIKIEEDLASELDAFEQVKSNESWPADMLPEDVDIINPTGRRVSVAAGMVIIPGEFEERTVGSGKKKRKYWSARSISHGETSNSLRMTEISHRRKSDEPIKKIKTIIPIDTVVSQD